MARSRTHTFGPGALESITTRTTVMRRDHDGNGMYLITVSGDYAVYCGMGDTHWVRISQRDTVWSSDLHDERAQMALAAHAGSVDAARDLADLFVSYALEDWFDPCDDGMVPA